MQPRNVNYYDSVAYEKNEVVKATPGVLHRISGFNAHVAAVFVQLHDVASLPSNGDVPVFIISVPATSAFDFDFGDIGRYCLNGITVCSSSSGPDLTISGDTCWFSIQYT